MSGNRASLDTLLVGLDGACFGVLDPLFEAGAVPTLQGLFEAGVSGELESQVPPWTPSAWPSLYTGVNPGKHGVFGFLAFDGYDWDVVNRTHVREYALWELLDQQGRSSVVVNVPVTSPPSAIDGAIVPGYIAPEAPTCQPEGVLDELRAELGDYRVYAPADVTDEAEQVEWYRRLTEMRGEAFRYLCGEFDPDFGFVQFQQTDTVIHEYPGDAEKLRGVYEAVDDQLDRILETCDPDTVVVASDHGVGPYEGYEFRVNDYLHEQGFVETARGGDGMPSWSTIGRNRLQQGEEGGTVDRAPLERAVALGARVGLTSQRLGRILGTVGLRDVVLRHVSLDTVRAGKEHVDFPASRAYVRSRVECGVRINRAGREPAGTVSDADYEAVRTELVDVLSAARTPDGDPVFSEVVPREAVFSGPYVEDAPDVLTVPTDFEHFLSAQVHGATAEALGDRWNHKLDGVVAAAGDGVDPAAGTGDAHLFDIAPTVLATLGLPAADRMDGRALPFVAAPGVTDYPTYTPDVERTSVGGGVESRLTDLGYLEE